MPNSHRGEVALTLGAARYTLCLTLGALADLEAAFGVEDLGAVVERFGSGRLSSRDVLTLLAVALLGGGHALSYEAVAALPLPDGIEPVAQALADLLLATFGASPANPPLPQGA